MPVKCAIAIEPISTAQFAELDYIVMRHAFASQNRIGRLADERIYQADIARQLRTSGISSHSEVCVEVTHKTLFKSLFLDLVVANKGVYELKSVAKLTKEHVSQLLTYLYLLDLPRGKLINFRTPKVESQFVNAPVSRTIRCGFDVLGERFSGPSHLQHLAIEILRDLGTALSISLYIEILTHLLGGDLVVNVMLPLTVDGSPLGNQRFHLVTPEEAFQLTAFNEPAGDYEYQLQNLLALSPLRAIHWINVAIERVSFVTISKP